MLSGAGDANRAAAARNRRALILCWALYIIAVWVVAWPAGTDMPSLRLPAPPPGPVGGLSAWDGEHYRAIAQHAYTTEERRLAFFPALPAIARALGGSDHAALAGILLNQLLLLASILMLSSWRGERAAPGLRGEPGFWLMIQPLGFFLAAFYTESLFLFLTLAALAAQRARRTLAGAAALVLAGLTRPTAITLPALFLRDAWRDPAKRRTALLLAAAPLAGIALYLGAVGILTGDPFGYTRIHEELWRHRWQIPFAPALADLRIVLHHALGGHVPPRDVLLRPLALAMVLALLISGWRHLEPPLRAYMVVSLLFIHAQFPSYSSARYDLALFPVFILLARARFVRGPAGWLLAAAFAVLQLGFLLDFLIWRWVG